MKNCSSLLILYFLTKNVFCQENSIEVDIDTFVPCMLGCCIIMLTGIILQQVSFLLLSNKISLIEKNLLDNNKKLDETIIDNVYLIQNTPDVIFLNNIYLNILISVVIFLLVFLIYNLCYVFLYNKFILSKKILI